MTVDTYMTQKAQYNRTIQHTVAAAMDGVTPDRVTDILVSSSSSTRAGKEGGASQEPEPHAGGAGGSACSLRYTVRVFDPLLSLQALRTQLAAVAASGKMADDLQHFAGQFGASSIQNGTFSAPQVTNAAAGGGEDEGALTGGGDRRPGDRGSDGAVYLASRGCFCVSPA